MKRIMTWLASAAVLLSPVAAGAADLAVKAPPVTPVAAVYNWTGFYIGLNGGYGWGSQDALNLLTDRFDRVSFDLNGGFIGGTGEGSQAGVGGMLGGILGR